MTKAGQKFSFVFQWFIDSPFFFGLILVLLFLGAYWMGSHTLDPDFGWHLRTGQLIAQKGIPYQDPYTFTMPNYPWGNHEWLSDFIIFKLYSLVGYQGTAAFFALLAAFAFLLLIPLKNLKYGLLPIILTYSLVLPFLGIRPCVFTFFFFALFLKLVSLFLEQGKTWSLWLIPPMIALWANLHGGFLLALFYLLFILIWHLLSRFSKVRNWFWKYHFQLENQNLRLKPLVLVSIISPVLPLLNPYYLQVYREMWLTISDQRLSRTIVEWWPLFYTSPRPIFLIYFGCLFGFILAFFQKLPAYQIFFTLILFLLTFLHQRFLPLFLIFSLPLFAQAITNLVKKLPPSFVASFPPFYWPGISLAFVLIFLGFLFSHYPLSQDPESSYPKKAVAFLKTLPLSENLFNEYNWGGYLIWKVPERKVFVDGRMPSWRYQGKDAFGDYLKIRDAQPGFEKLLDRYQIKLALLAQPEETKEKRGKNQKNRQKDLVQLLLEKGWQKIYEDEQAVVIRRNF